MKTNTSGVTPHDTIPPKTIFNNAPAALVEHPPGGGGYAAVTEFTYT